MANRHTLHISKLDSFKEWLAKDGWEIEEPKGVWEVLRARKFGRNNPLIVYRKADAKEHLSLMDRDSGVVGAFLRDCKKPKTNADRIRSMSVRNWQSFSRLYQILCASQRISVWRIFLIVENVRKRKNVH